MAGKPTLNGELAKALLRKYPDYPIKTLANILYKENPEAFKGVEHARTTIRHYVGQGSRKPGDKSLVREKTYNYNPFNLPESYAEPWDHFEIKESRTLVLSDPHFPYQDNEAITVALNYGLEKKVNCILLNGDIIDFATISKHEQDWKYRKVGEEFEAVRAFLKGLRATFPKARIVYKLGNHDERWEKWLTVKAPELLKCSDFELEVLLRFGEHKVEIVKDKRVIMVGKLPVLHGHELAGNGGINPGRSTFLKTFSSALIGHVHKRSNNEAKSLLDEHFTTQSMGCLCGLHPKFMRVNQWSHGFAYIEQDREGNFELENIKIVRGKIYK